MNKIHFMRGSIDRSIDRWKPSSIMKRPWLREISQFRICFDVISVTVGGTRTKRSRDKRYHSYPCSTRTTVLPEYCPRRVHRTSATRDLLIKVLSRRVLGVLLLARVLFTQEFVRTRKRHRKKIIGYDEFFALLLSVCTSHIYM